MPLNGSNPDKAILTWVTGFLGATTVVVMDAISNCLREYYHHIPSIDLVLIHLAKLGGIVVTYYSILILHRKWKSGSKNIGL